MPSGVDSERLPYPYPTSAAVTAAMKANRRRDTRPEIALRSALHARGLRFRVDFPVLAGGCRVRPDIVFTRARVAVFVDGCFFHCCPAHGNVPKVNQAYWVPKLHRNRTRDTRNNNELRAEGWRVIRAWEHEEVEDVVHRIQSYVASVCTDVTLSIGTGETDSSVDC